MDVVSVGRARIGLAGEDGAASVFHISEGRGGAWLSRRWRRVWVLARRWPSRRRRSVGATYTLNRVDDYWFGPDGLPPISAKVTIEGNSATITRSNATGTPRFRFFYVSGGLSGMTMARPARVWQGRGHPRDHRRR